MQGSYVFHSDAGHGWLEVPRADIDELGVGRCISRYSYQRDDRVYLEEDADMSLFLRACSARDETGDIVDGRHVNESPIRGYARYQA